jgi:MFS family permease
VRPRSGDDSSRIRSLASGVSGTRDLGLFQLYRFLSTPYLFAPVLMVFFAGRGLTITQITLLNTVYCVTAMLFEVPTGLLADRWGRKRAMVLGSLMMAAGCALDWVGRGFATFAVGESLLALGMTLTSGADSAYLYDLLLDAGREREYRRREGAASAAKLVGAALALAAGGWLARRDVSATYLATAGLCLLASVTAALLREPRAHLRVLPPWQGVATRRAAPILGAMFAAARTALSHRPLRFAILFSTLIFTLVRMSIYVHQPYLSAAGFELPSVGAIMAVLSLVAALGAHRIDAVRRRVGERALVVGLPLVLALSYLVLGHSVASWGVALLVVQSLANGIYSPLSKELLNREIVDSAQRATVLSVESMVRRLAFGGFAPLAGAAMDAGGLAGGLYACAGLGVLGAVALAVHVATRRSLDASGFEGERTPTPLPDLDNEGVPEPVATVISGGER